MAQYAAVIDVAAGIAHEALDLRWEYREPLGDLWHDIIAGAVDAAGEERALAGLVSWAHAHDQAFYGRHQEDRGKPKQPATGWAGRWDAGNDWEFVALFPTVLDKVLRDLGYEPEAVLRGWRERGWLDIQKDDRKRYTKQVRVRDGVSDSPKPHMVVIRRAAVDGVEKTE